VIPIFENKGQKIAHSSPVSSPVPIDVAIIKSVMIGGEERKAGIILPLVQIITQDE
jgi:hypothetical protein